MGIIYGMDNLTKNHSKSSPIAQFSEIFPRKQYYELSGTIENNILKQNPTQIIAYLRERTPIPNEGHSSFFE